MKLAKFSRSKTAGQYRVDHQRQRGGGEERKSRVRHEQGGRESPGARIGCRNAPLVRVNAVAPATVVKGSTMFPRDRVIASLTKYGSHFAGMNRRGTEDKLASFYARRSLTQKPVEPEDQAEAIFLLISPRLSKTTGHMIPVDGGLQDGFLR